MIGRMERAHRFGEIGEVLFAYAYYNISLKDAFLTVYGGFDSVCGGGILRHGHTSPHVSHEWEVDFLLYDYSGERLISCQEVKTTSNRRNYFEINGKAPVYYELADSNLLMIGVVRMENLNMFQVPESVFDTGESMLQYLYDLPYFARFRIEGYFPFRDGFEIRGGSIYVHPSNMVILGDSSDMAERLMKEKAAEINKGGDGE